MNQIKTILITGSTSGIGLGIAKVFAEKGPNIIFNGFETNEPEMEPGQDYYTNKTITRR